MDTSLSLPHYTSSLPHYTTSSGAHTSGDDILSGPNFFFSTMCTFESAFALASCRIRVRVLHNTTRRTNTPQPPTPHTIASQPHHPHPKSSMMTSSTLAYPTPPHTPGPQQPACLHIPCKGRPFALFSPCFPVTTCVGCGSGFSWLDRIAVRSCQFAVGVER